MRIDVQQRRPRSAGCLHDHNLHRVSTICHSERRGPDHTGKPARKDYVRRGWYGNPETVRGPQQTKRPRAGGRAGQRPRDGFPDAGNRPSGFYGAIDTSAFSMVARSKDPRRYFISEPLAIDPFAIMLRKSDIELKEIADRTIEQLFKSGEINPLYQKWFQSPLPRLGFNLNMPMSDALKHAIENPTDDPRSE